MTMIDGDKVGNAILKCGKKIKVSQAGGLLVLVLGELAPTSPVMHKVKVKLGEKQFQEMADTIITFYGLNLLARTHDSKEYNRIFKELQVEEQA